MNRKAIVGFINGEVNNLRRTLNMGRFNIGLFNLFRKQFLDIIEWTEDAAGVLAFRFPMQDREIQNGAHLTVRDTQLALFVNEGEVADLFEPGRHQLTTNTLPVLTGLKHWDKGFKSPFKSEIYFFSTREQLDQRWGTPNAITVRDPELGAIRVRAHGTYAYRIRNPRVFFRKVSGTRDVFRIDEMEGQLRSVILTALASILGEAKISFVDLSASQMTLSNRLKETLGAAFEEYGLELRALYVQSVSLPEAPSKSGAAAGEDAVALLAQLHDLMTKGVLTPDEFERKKAELLSRIQ